MFVVLALMCAAQVHVVDGEHSQRLAEALAKEPDLVIGTATTATVSIALTASSTSALTLRVREVGGATLLERTIDLGRGIDPALRMAVLLVRGALEPEVAPVLEPPETPLLVPSAVIGPMAIAIEDQDRWGIEATLSLATTNLDPALMIALSARWNRLTFGPVFAGVWGGTQSTGTIEGSIRDVFVFADAAWSFTDNVALFASFGLDAQRFEIAAESPPFRSPGTSRSHDELVPVVLGGVALRLPIAGRFAFSARAGTRWLPQRIEVGLPQEFVDENPISETVTPLKSSPFALFASAGVAIEVF